MNEFEIYLKKIVEHTARVGAETGGSQVCGSPFSPAVNLEPQSYADNHQPSLSHPPMRCGHPAFHSHATNLNLVWSKL
jgi:hypothetical protein